ncbi:MAG: hypothetical protein ACE5I1_08860 [bacterium]
MIFGWVVFESREAHDLANERVAADPRMADLINPLTHTSRPIFDAKRMVYGGFRSLVQSSNQSGVSQMKRIHHGPHVYLHTDKDEMYSRINFSFSLPCQIQSSFQQNFRRPAPPKPRLPASAPRRLWASRASP